MFDFTGVVGDVTEASRFINPNRDNIPASHWPERREIWVWTLMGDQRKFIIHSQLFAARKGHRVFLLLHHGEVVGLFNMTTMEVTNYVRVSPPRIFYTRDLLLASAASVGAEATWHRQAMVVGLPVWFITVATRLIHRSLMRREVDNTLAVLRENESSVNGPQP
jgi:hypothetical protein